MKPTHERVLGVLRYNKRTGIFHWRVALSNRSPAGGVAGTNSHGYVVISIDGHVCRAHHLAIFYVTGKWPPRIVDHRNGVRSDNRYCNLRNASDLINVQNQRHASKNNKVGALGVCRCKSTGRYRVQILAEGKKFHVGRYDTVSEAHAAYIQAKRKLHLGNTL